MLQSGGHNYRTSNPIYGEETVNKIDLTEYNSTIDKYQVLIDSILLDLNKIVDEYLLLTGFTYLTNIGITYRFLRHKSLHELTLDEFMNCYTAVDPVTGNKLNPISQDVARGKTGRINLAIMKINKLISNYDDTEVQVKDIFQEFINYLSETNYYTQEFLTFLNNNKYSMFTCNDNKIINEFKRVTSTIMDEEVRNSVNDQFLSMREKVRKISAPNINDICNELQFNYSTYRRRIGAYTTRLEKLLGYELNGLMTTIYKPADII